MKKIWLILIFLVNLTPNIVEGTFTLTSMNRIFAQLGINEFICEDEYGVFDSSIPCDEIPCIAVCEDCGEQNICVDEHICQEEECETCGDYYIVGGYHDCGSPICCSICYQNYYPMKGHSCQGDNDDDHEDDNDDDPPTPPAPDVPPTIPDPTPPTLPDEEDTDTIPDNEEKTPCDKVTSLNIDKEFQDNLKRLTLELLNNEGSATYPEKMWYKTINGDFYWNTGVHENVSATPEILSSIKGVKITEHFHTHPSGGSMPSPSDINAIVKDYNRGNINYDSYNYGIIGARFVVTIYINSYNDFENFADYINNCYEEFRVEVEEEIKTHNSDTTANHSLEGNLNRFINIINSYNTGLGFSFTKHPPLLENDIELIQIGELTPVVNGEILTEIDC